MAGGVGGVVSALPGVPPLRCRPLSSARAPPAGRQPRGEAHRVCGNLHGESRLRRRNVGHGVQKPGGRSWLSPPTARRRWVAIPSLSVGLLASRSPSHRSKPPRAVTAPLPRVFGVELADYPIRSLRKRRIECAPCARARRRMHESAGACGRRTTMSAPLPLTIARLPQGRRFFRAPFSSPIPPSARSNKSA